MNKKLTSHRRARAAVSSNRVVRPSLKTLLGIRVGYKVRWWRTERKMTLPRLAEKSGLSKGLLSAIENGNGNPTVETLGALADALEIKPDHLLLV